MPNRRMDHLVSTAWLEQNLASPDLVILDASWHMPQAGRDARAEYREGHIPGAMFFDIDEISDHGTSLPHMLPSPAKFASQVKHMGVGDGMRIVVYDAAGLFSAARVWWMFRAMGHEEIAVLDGGLPKWKAEGRPVTAEPPALRSSRHFTPRVNAGLIRDLADVKALLHSGAEQIADARGPGRFTGAEPEPRAGLRSGHIPGSRNVHYARLLNADGTMRAGPELAAVFDEAGIDIGRPVVASCGSGVTASIVALALAQLGRADTAVYDGSWSEWGLADVGTPVETGTPRG